MAIFEFRAENQKGQMVDGRVEALNYDAAGQLLMERGLRIVDIVEQGKSIIGKEFFIFKGVPVKDLVIFVRQLATLISANVPLVRSLQSLVGQTNNPRLRLVVSEIADDVDGGASFSTALSKYPNIFDAYFLSIIRAGESSGKLDDILEYLASQAEREYDLISRFKGMMIYPVFILFALIGVAILTITFVLPNLTDILKETQTNLPLATRILIALSDFFIVYWWGILLFIFSFIIFLFFYHKTPRGALHLDYMKLKIPIFGKLVQKVYLIRFTQGLHTLVKGGVNLVSGLNIIANVTNNVIYRDIILQAAKSVEDGNRLSESLAKSQIVPPLVYQMIDVGETSGKLDIILEKVANFYRREVDSMINNLMGLLEPAIIVMLGVGVAFILLAVVVPLYNISAQL